MLRILPGLFRYGCLAISLVLITAVIAQWFGSFLGERYRDTTAGLSVQTEGVGFRTSEGWVAIDGHSQYYTREAIPGVTFENKSTVTWRCVPWVEQDPLISPRWPTIFPGIRLQRYTGPGQIWPQHRWYVALAVANPWVLLFASILATPFMLGVFRSLRRRARQRSGCCSHCGYDLRGAPPESPTCPECGHARHLMRTTA